jgi:anionic cell wall polymer biosynthesis LytR-Cps2A-Psr (LCP) family protein
MDTVELNFGVKPNYYMRIRFEGFREVVDALGGVVIELDEPMAGYPAGTHYLKPRKALAFVRHRATSDDFSRMSNGQFMLRTLYKNLLNPRNWPRLPAVIKAITNAVDTNIPRWLWPRLAFTLLRVGPGGIDSRVIDRDMTTPFTTNAGASVLAPNWASINVILIEMFQH